MTATINVSLAPCSMKCHKDSSHGHFRGCAAFPVLIPCPIPRSVTFEVRLGMCLCHGVATAPNPTQYHHAGCAGTTIRVSCSISGSTWEETQVGEEIECAPSVSALVEERIWAACRDRWALVKALVLGFTRVTLGGITRPQADALFNQRDAVYAALADMARAEVEMLEAQQRTVAAIASPRLTASETRPEDRPSAQALAVYVERLVEQVSVLQ